MHSKAIEAAALAIFREQLLLDDDECRRATQAAIAAYLAAMEAEGFILASRADMTDRYTYLAKLGDWAAGEGFCQIEGVEDPEEYIFRAWSQVGPENGDGYTAEALAEAMLAAARPNVKG